jgi:hypothetical protein
VLLAARTRSAGSTSRCLCRIDRGVAAAQPDRLSLVCHLAAALCRPASAALVAATGGCAPAYYLAFHLQAVGRPDLEAWLPPLLGFGPAWAALLWSRGRASWPIRG